MPAHTPRAAGAIAMAIACAVGFGMTLQGGVNSFLANLLQRDVGDGDGDLQPRRSPTCGTYVAAFVLAALVSFVGGVACLVIFNAADAAHETLIQRRPLTRMRRPEQLWDACGGLLGATIMMLHLFALQETGFALSSVLRATGTALCSLTVDHVGCCGTTMRRATLQRVLGVSLLLAGSAASVAHELIDDLQHASTSIDASTSSTTNSSSSSSHLLFYSALPLASGALLPVQGLANGRLAKRLGRPLRATLVSFIGGTAALGVSSLACGSPHHALSELVHAPWYCFTGGFLGLLAVSANFLLPHYIGFATVGGCMTSGNLASSLALDWVGAFGFGKRPPTLLRLAGVALALVGALATRPKSGAAERPLLRAANAAAATDAGGSDVVVELADGQAPGDAVSSSGVRNGCAPGAKCKSTVEGTPTGTSSTRPT